MVSSTGKIHSFPQANLPHLGTRINPDGQSKRISVPLGSQKFLKAARNGELVPHYFTPSSDPFIAERLAEDADRRFGASVIGKIQGLTEQYDAIVSDPELRVRDQLKQLTKLQESESISQLLQFLESDQVITTDLDSDEILDLTSKLQNIRDLKLVA